MRFLVFLADHIFRFSYKDPTSDTGGMLTWDLSLQESETDKMLRDFFVMGLVVGVVVSVAAYTVKSVFL